jgi:hypothetical protein
MNFKIFMARWISIIGHPFVLIILLVLMVLSVRSGGGVALKAAAVVLAAGVVPLWFFMWRSHATGRWETIDASSPKNRPVAYLAGFAVLLMLSLYFFLAVGSSEMLRGCAALAVMLGAAAALNRRIKLSIHMAFAVFTGIISMKIYPGLGLAILIGVPALGWSRLALARHTLREVIGGCVLGVVVGIITIWPYL